MLARPPTQSLAHDDLGISRAMVATGYPVPRADNAAAVRFDKGETGMVRGRSMRLLGVLAVFYGLAIIIGFALFIAVTQFGLFGSVSILFYRGLAGLGAIAPALVLVLALMLRLPWPLGMLAGRDAVLGAVVALCLNLTLFVLGPVTVDRSLSVFMLSSLAEAKAPLTAEDLKVAFTARYLREWDQVGRRLKEQIASGNVDRTPEGTYRLTPQGRSFMKTAQAMSRLFGGDPRFVGSDLPQR
jgi:hypothetical protein